MSGWNNSDRKSRLPSDWHSHLVPAVMARDRRVCHVCGGAGSDAVDHIVPGDNHDLSNLAPIHQDVWPYCHRYKTAGEAQQARAAIRALRTRPAEPHPLDQLKGK
jgi:5-methylcytosine-specific restriction protein A